MGPTVTGPFREAVSLGSREIIWNPNEAVDIGEWSICGGGRLGRFDCTPFTLNIQHIHNVILYMQTWY